MNRIAGRAWVLWLLVSLLLGGVGFFLYEYAVSSHKWVMHSANPHVYQGGAQTVACGKVTDRDGIFLLDLGNGRQYAHDSYLRAATLHWLGDRSGNIAAPALSHYAKELAGFTPVNGIYGYGGTGANAKLTLSAPVQKTALEALGSYKGTVAVYNYRTGEILCAVSTPAFDPDHVPDFSMDTAGLYEGVYLNRFTQSVYIPGSIFKIVTTAAALETLPDVRRQSFTCTGTFTIGGDKVTCERAHGTLTLKNAMARSCNCYYANLALRLGADTLEDRVEAYGVTKPVSFDGIVTARGNFSAAGQQRVELAWSAIGQHKDQINPCAFLTFVGAIANGGQGVKPYVMASVGEYQAQPQPMERIMSEDTAAILQEYMRNNVVNNYGADNFPGLTVCAKSGTGQVSGQRPNAMFVGFVSDEQYPLAFIAAVENAGYGKQVCVPILSKVLSACRDVLDGA
jgi:peptidoglycan glycosyltransferase